MAIMSNFNQNDNDKDAAGQWSAIKQVTHIIKKKLFSNNLFVTSPNSDNAK